MNKLDWNIERYRTRDRLIEYDISIMPLYPHSGGIALPYPYENKNIMLTIPDIIAETELHTVYPWENYQLHILSHQLYTLVKENGFDGTEQQFLNKFSNLDTATENTIIVGTISTFPQQGEETSLYLDKETGVLYYFKSTTNIIDSESMEQKGIIIVGQTTIEDTQEIVTYLYIPVRALLQEDIILNSGDASEYIG